MSKISVRHEHTLTMQEARARIQAFEGYMAKYGARLVWDGDRADVKGPGVSGSATLGQGFIEVVIKLGMLARAAGVDPPRLEGSIRKRLVATFAPEPEA